MRSIDNRYLSPELVMKGRFINNPKPEWRIAILCFRDYIGCEILVHTFKANPVKGYKLFYGIDSNETERQVFEADVQGIKVGIITRLSWGGPQAAILVEELTQMGVQYIVGYGAAGSIYEGVNKGDIVIGTKSLNTDGTSQTYIPDKQVLLCDEELLHYAREEAIRLNIELKEVIVANVDALYRETKDLILNYQSDGAQIINLETSALFASSEICNASSLWIGFISDSLVSESWDDWDIDSKELSVIVSELCRSTVERITNKILESRVL